VQDLMDALAPAKAECLEVESWLLEAARRTLAELKEVPGLLRKAMEAEDPTGLRGILPLVHRAGIPTETIRKGEKLFSDIQAGGSKRLQAAVENRRLPELLEAISWSRTVGLEEQDVVAAEAVLEDLKLTTKELLQQSVDGSIERSIEEYTDDVTNGRLAGLHKTILIPAEALLAKRKQVFNNIKHAIASGDCANVKTAISRGRKAGVPMIDLKVAYTFLTEIKDQQMDALKKAIDAKDVEHLPRVIADARKAGCDEKDLKDAVWFLQKLTQARSTIRSAIKDGTSAAAISNAVSNARTWGLDMPEIEQAEALLVKHRERSLVQLRQAILQKSRVELHIAVSEVENSHFTEDEETDGLLKQARALMSEAVVWSTEMLREAVKSRSCEQLKEALDIAWGNAVCMDLIKEGKDLLIELKEKEGRRRSQELDGTKVRKHIMGQSKHIYDLQDSNVFIPQHVVKRMSVDTRTAEEDEKSSMLRIKAEKSSATSESSTDEEFAAIRESLRRRADKKATSGPHDKMPSIESLSAVTEGRLSAVTEGRLSIESLSAVTEFAEGRLSLTVTSLHEVLKEEPLSCQIELLRSASKAVRGTELDYELPVSEQSLTPVLDNSP